MKRYDSSGWENPLGGWVRWVDSDAALAQLRESNERYDAAITEACARLKTMEVENNRLREALAHSTARYEILRNYTVPRKLCDRLGLQWVNIPTYMTIEEKIDELCDAAIARQAEKEKS